MLNIRMERPDTKALCGRGRTRTCAGSQSVMELNKTAYLLGYSDPNSFFRALNS